MWFCGGCGTPGPETSSEGSSWRCPGCGTVCSIETEPAFTSGFCLTCPGCSRPSVWDLESEGQAVSCPRCWLRLELPTRTGSQLSESLVDPESAAFIEDAGELTRGVRALLPPPGRPEDLCGICLSAFDLPEPVHSCPECDARYHLECWQENRGCGVYGCSETPEEEPLRAIEIPFSHWGLQTKSCPRCRQEIRAAAIRCRGCGAVFPSPDPVDRETYLESEHLRRRRPWLQGTLAVMGILALFPPTAPVAVGLGLLGLSRGRRDLGGLPRVAVGLTKIALVIAVGQTLVLMVWVLWRVAREFVS